MAKKKSTVWRDLRKGAKAFAKGFDKSADWMAKHTGGKPAKQRRASVEWTAKAGGKGEHLPLQAQRGLAWGTRQTHADKEWWRVTYVDGFTTEFLTWPPRDDSEARRLAAEHVGKLYGVYAESWEIRDVSFSRKAVEDELPEDAKA
jgi:hypothetical protein